MARPRRVKPKDGEYYYHIISRTAANIYINDEEKFKLLNTIFYFSKIFFFNILSYCIMGNHFHLIVRSKLKEGYKEEEHKLRLKKYLIKNRKNVDDLTDKEYKKYLNKLEDISAYVANIKQDFARWYNETNNKKGCFWGSRFKNPMLVDKEGLLNCISYVELNPIRANIVKYPEAYSFSSIHCRKYYPNRAKEELSLEGVFENVGKSRHKDLYKAYKEMIYNRVESLCDSYVKRKQSPFKSFKNRAKLFLKRSDAFSNGQFIGSKENVVKFCKKFNEEVIKKRDKEAYLVDDSEALFIARNLKKPK